MGISKISSSKCLHINCNISWIKDFVTVDSRCHLYLSEAPPTTPKHGTEVDGIAAFYLYSLTSIAVLKIMVVFIVQTCS